MKPISRLDYEAKMTAQADKDFAGHVIRSSDEWRWTIGTPDGSSIYSATICVPRPGYLVVVGDISTVCLYGGYPEPRQQVSWAGQSSIGYFGEKCAIGMGGRETTDRYEPEVMLADLADWIDPDMHRVTTEMRSTVKDAMAMLKNGDGCEEVARLLYESDFDVESVGNMGRVPAIRVFYARAACKRLHELLCEREKAEVPCAAP